MDGDLIVDLDFGEARPDQRPESPSPTVLARGIYDKGGAEIAAFDPASKRVFVVNAQDATVDALDLSNPATPTRAFTIDVQPYRAVANSVATYKGVIALNGGKVYAFVQNPLRNPSTLENSDLNAMQNIRVLEFDPANNTTRQFLEVMDNPNLGGAGNTRADKIGDAVSEELWRHPDAPGHGQRG